jgi:hypothetical protein
VLHARYCGIFRLSLVRLAGPQVLQLESVYSNPIRDDELTICRGQVDKFEKMMSRRKYEMSVSHEK